ncbi:MAG: inorganic phosphate transporter [Bacteroidetes bacterium RIFCSPLOWO2_02_FULL_36_8]|nr:MAG: inorganic phosphate transporter [Bacteroidetes bacterium RIFCSPLOWO2_02_FULL_36_8]OFY68838.1 MAG: inorganic phosphate transporter [Bacteroidetes bacterium RIFCSPLOWO2_12_FULL_37_12]
MLTIVIITIILALAFDFLNGMNDAANSIATVVSTRVLRPNFAVAWAAFFNFAAVFIFGLHVANTIGKGIVEPHIVNEYMILSALVGGIIWVYFCTIYGLPISVSHSLIGGLIGAGIAKGGVQVLILSGISKVILFIFLSPVFGVILGGIFMIVTQWIFRKWRPQAVDGLFKVGQLVSSAAYSLGHGSNDAQKTMGVIAILLYSTGYLGKDFYIPTWVIFSCYTVIGLGTLVGGKKVIKTLGVNLTHLKPVGGFCAEISSAFTLFGTALAGIPVSTTHSITGSIMGVGMVNRFSAVRWGVASNIMMAWVLTIPASGLMSWLVYTIISWWV